MKDLVSVCLPNYNRAEHLPVVIDSILNQTYKNLELIIADDGSDDYSSCVLERLTDPIIKVIYSDHRGISATRKTAFENSKGEYIAIVDSDTPMHQDKLQESLDHLKRTKADIVYTGAYAVYDGEVVGTFMPEDINKVIKKPKDILDRKNKDANQVVPNYTVLAKRKCFEGAYREDFTVNDDLWTIYYWVKKGYKFSRLDKLLMYHISDSKNVSTTQSRLVKKFTEQLRMEEKI